MMSEKKEQRPVNDKAIIPMTIHQIRSQLRDDSTFENQNFHTVSIVGRLESFRRENRYFLVMFNDGTGTMEGQINIGEGGRLPSFAEGIPFEGKQGEYFFVVIKPKFSEERKYYVHMAKELRNFNQITKHHSDVVLSHLIRNSNAR